MKSKIFLASIVFSLALVFQPLAQGQRRPTADTGNPKAGGIFAGGAANIINSKLLIYTKNGVGTTSTSQSGEFASQLVPSATVDNEFALQWSRTKTGKAEKGMVYIRRAATPGVAESYVVNLSPVLQAQSKAVDIGFTMPSFGPDTYEIRVVGETGNSSKVTINYTGKGNKGPAVVIMPAPNNGSPASTKSPLYITGAKFTPAVGAPGEPGYKRARLDFTLRSHTATSISKIEVEVWSESFTNAELLTSSAAKNSPIIIFKGKLSALGGSNQILTDKDNKFTVTLRRQTKNDVDAEETSPGFYSPADWGHAFAQTKTASFRWSVSGPTGKLSGTFEMSPQKPWLWP